MDVGVTNKLYDKFKRVCIFYRRLFYFSYHSLFFAFRSTVIIEGGIHAREWIGAAFVTYFIRQIVDSANSKNEALKLIGSTYEFIFIPVANPDGYEFTHTKVNLK